MSVFAIRFRARCDVCCIERDYDNRFDLRKILISEGWVFDRKKNGERALRGGKDYCAGCKPGEVA